MTLIRDMKSLRQMADCSADRSIPVSVEGFDEIIAALESTPPAGDAGAVDAALAAAYRNGWNDCAMNGTPAAAPGDSGASEDAIYEAWKSWPDDIKKKLSLYDLRRMNGWVPIPSLIPPQPPISNEFVATGCEKFAATPVAAGGVVVPSVTEEMVEAGAVVMAANFFRHDENQAWVRLANSTKTTFRGEAREIIEAAIAAAQERAAQGGGYTADDADMFWNHDDAEQCGDSIAEIVGRAYEDGAEDGTLIEVQRAVNVGNVWAKLVFTENGEDYEYEIVPAPPKTAGG